MLARQADTNIVSYFFRHDPLADDYRPYFVGYRTAVSFQTVGELLAGADFAGWGLNKRSRLHTTINGYLVLHSDDVVCRQWAFVRYHRRHRPISPDDAWVAATALAYDLELVTHNRKHFDGIPGLRVLSLSP